jgi:hypothetical protein
MSNGRGHLFITELKQRRTRRQHSERPGHNLAHRHGQLAFFTIQFKEL